MVKLTTVRLLLALVATEDGFLHQLNVDNAFLHGDLNEEVYMLPPPDLAVSKKGQVYRLTKSLYGLKQANSQWFAKLYSFLISIDFIQFKSDQSLFVKKPSTNFTTLLLCR